MKSHIGLVAEGPADGEALQLLVRRHLHQRGVYTTEVGRPLVANGRPKLLARLTSFVRAAALRPGVKGILVVFDTDNDLACELGPAMLEEAQAATALPVRVCATVRVFENWIAASSETVFEERADLVPLSDPEGRGALELVKSGLGSTSYKKRLHQPKLTNRIDLDLAATRCPSFARLRRCIDELAEANE